MSKLLYDLFIHLYPLAVRIVSPFNEKAKQWLKGRENLLEKMAATIRTNKVDVWMHCSSLGEFEQGRPVLEKLRNVYPGLKILLTFFSPSGYEVRKNYSGADYVFYLPMDNRKNAHHFFETVNPALVLFVKYEYWYYYLAEAKKRSIPAVLISGVFRKDQPFFKWYGALHRKMLSFFHHLFVQTDESAALARRIGFDENVSVSGDTRFDRVIEIAESFEPIGEIEEFIKEAKVIVAGSTWSEDDEELNHFANGNEQVKFIIAPHDIGNTRIAECKKLYKQSILFSQLGKTNETGKANTLIIDNIGMLSRLYKYATICYVGGAFGEDGVHNVLEAAVYGKPVVFGPEYEKYIEAAKLIEWGGGISIENAVELENELSGLLSDASKYDSVANASRNYVYSNRGATDAILNYIQENRLLTR